MKRYIIASLLAAVGGFSSLPVLAGGGESGGSGGHSSGEIYTTSQTEVCAYHEQGSEEGYYLCLSLFPYSSNNPSEWYAIVSKLTASGAITEFEDNIKWIIKEAGMDRSGDFLADAGATTLAEQINLSFIPCNTTVLIRARVNSPPECEDCFHDTGVIQVHRTCSM